MRKIITAFLLTALIAAAVSCSAADTIGIRGNVTALTANGDSIFIMVEGSVEKDTSYDKASVTVMAGASIVFRKDGKVSAAELSDIVMGSKVEVVFDGAVAESYPVQGKAKKVIILG